MEISNPCFCDNRTLNFGHYVLRLLLEHFGSYLEDVCGLMGMKKVNTVAYYPQTYGLVEKMNRTLRSMIAKYTSWTQIKASIATNPSRGTI